MDDSEIQGLLTKHHLKFAPGMLTPALDIFEMRMSALMNDVFEQGYVKGIHMERRLLRIRLGLPVPGDVC